ncbi:MAG: DUF4331 domain-containing protein, partial [Burkholderiales bacterium]|nr:DUF4331 domain-containing protein [Opitutaceae bacterium]
MTIKLLQALACCAGALVAASGYSASHSDAPLSKQDPQTNITDVYAFVGQKFNNPGVKVLNVIVQVRPFCEPGDGVIYDRFADDARYSIHITNPVKGTTLRRYDFRFSGVSSAGYKNRDTILSYGLGTAAGPIANIGDARQNYVQTYTVARVIGTSGKLIASNFPTPPPNVGPLTTPAYNDEFGRALSGAATWSDLDLYTKQGVFNTLTGETVFAGPRDDGFYADTPGIFDFLNSRILDNNGTLADGLGQDGGGVDGFKGYNILSFAIQIPLEELPAIAYTAPFTGPATGVGVYATVSRQQTTVRRSTGFSASGPWVQVNRMGNPLFNEVLVALRDKDAYNRSSPVDDAKRFGRYADKPEIAALLNTIYGTEFVTTGRTDLTAVFIPDVIRVNTSTAPVRLAGQEGFSRLSFIGADTTDGAAGGWPNGRRFGDDVVDIALTAVASGPAYSAITLAGDNVTTNDIAYNQVFPYAATPHSGTNNRKDPAVV